MSKLEFSFSSEPTRGWLTRVLFSAVAHGIRYNVGRFNGTYRVIPGDPSLEVVETELGNIDRTEDLVDAIETYFSFDPASTELSFMTTYTGAKPELPCQIDVVPNGSGYLLSFGTNRSDFRSAGHLQSFLELPQAIFERFEFTCGASRYGEQEFVPVDAETARQDAPRMVTFYPPNMVDAIGREKLLESPAATVKELANGGVYLLASTDFSTVREGREKVKAHLRE